MPLIPVGRNRGAPGSRVDPLTTHGFAIEIGQVQLALFSECSGLQATVEVYQHWEGGCNDFEHILPVRTKFSNVTLKRGITDTYELWYWFEGVIAGKVIRQNVSIIVYDAAHVEAKRWNLSRAYPVKWVGPAFKAGENAISIETLELAHEGMKLSVA